MNIVDVHDRLRNLGDMRDGWYGPGSLKPRADDIYQCAIAAADIVRLGAGVTARDNGHLVLEFSRGPLECTIFILDDVYAFVADNTVTDDAFEFKYDRKLPFYRVLEAIDWMLSNGLD